MPRAGEIPFEWIADNTHWMRKLDTYNSMRNMLEITKDAYRRALWNDQHAYVEIWLEKDALSGVLYPVTSEWDVPLMVTRGYSSLSFLHEAAEAITEQGKPAYIYYFGDHDPSGRDITRATEAGLREFAPDAEIHFERVAVTLDQIERWHLPTRPTKQTDPRLKGFQGESVEVDAIAPSRLRRLARTCIERHIDRQVLARTQAIEAEERSLFESTFGRLFSNGAPAAIAPAELSALPDWPLDLPAKSILLPHLGGRWGVPELDERWTVLSGKAAEKIRRSIKAGKDAEDVAANYKIGVDQVEFVVAMLDLVSVTPDDIAASEIGCITPKLAAEARTLAALDRGLFKDVQAGRKTLDQALLAYVLKKLGWRKR